MRSGQAVRWAAEINVWTRRTRSRQARARASSSGVRRGLRAPRIGSAPRRAPPGRRVPHGTLTAAPVWHALYTLTALDTRTARSLHSCARRGARAPTAGGGRPAPRAPGRASRAPPRAPASTDLLLLCSAGHSPPGSVRLCCNVRAYLSTSRPVGTHWSFVTCCCYCVTRKQPNFQSLRRPLRWRRWDSILTVFCSFLDIGRLVGLVVVSLILGSDTTRMEVSTYIIIMHEVLSFRDV